MIVVPILFLLREPSRWSPPHMAETAGVLAGVLWLGAVLGSAGGVFGVAAARSLRERRGAGWPDVLTAWSGGFAGGFAAALLTITTGATAVAVAVFH